METDRIATLKIDDSALPPVSPEAEQERNIAIFDLLDGNHFRMLDSGAARGPYAVTLVPRDRQIVFSITAANGEESELTLPATAFRKRAKAYFGICESYFEAVRTHSPDEITRLDEGRKALHNEGADAVRERLAESVELDDNTSRRFFTLLCSLSYRA